MDQEPTTAEKMRRLPWSIIGNATNSVYVQLTFFGSLFVLFLSQLGLSKTTIGLLLSLIPFFGLVALFVAPAAARFGCKRTFVIFWGTRKIATLGLLLCPWVLARFGPQALLWFVAIVVAAFSLFRAIAITANYPWTQEYVPDSVRGKYSAISQVATNITGFLAIAGASYYLGSNPELRHFIVLFGVGTVVGMLSIWAYAYVPGGAPDKERRSEQATSHSMVQAARDPTLTLYLAGTGLVTLATAGLYSFVSLFMSEAVGLSDGQVVLLQGSSLIGGLLTSFVWGWAADRYGSRPVILLGLYFRAILPIFWFIMPRGSIWSLPIALGTTFWQGFATMGWAIGTNQQLYVDVVPPQKRTAYMAVYYAAASVAEGLSQLVSGHLLDTAKNFHASWLGFTLDRYSILFAAGIVLPLLGGLLLQRIRTRHTVSAARFAGMFLRGNPLLAMESLIGYQLARDETAAVSVTERLGRAKSPFTVEELTQALWDPRFNVRFEAIVSMAHHGLDPRLTEALIETLQGRDPALSTMAAWALGRSGDRQAIPSLREGLQAQYRSVQAHCARSLATLGDGDSAPALLERLNRESDEGLRVAFAAALGTLRCDAATPTLLAMLREQAHPQPQMELALALARIVGEEHYFVHLMRQMGRERGTALSQAVTALRKKLGNSKAGSEVRDLMNECAETLARQDVTAGIALLACTVKRFPLSQPATPAGQVLEACLAGIEAFGLERIEYTILALHTLNTLANSS
jgi:HEAT repeat protein